MTSFFPLPVVNYFFPPFPIISRRAWCWSWKSSSQNHGEGRGGGKLQIGLILIQNCDISWLDWAPLPFSLCSPVFHSFITSCCVFVCQDCLFICSQFSPCSAPSSAVQSGEERKFAQLMPIVWLGVGCPQVSGQSWLHCICCHLIPALCSAGKRSVCVLFIYLQVGRWSHQNQGYSHSLLWVLTRPPRGKHCCWCCPLSIFVLSCYPVLYSTCVKEQIVQLNLIILFKPFGKYL